MCEYVPPPPIIDLPRPLLISIHQNTSVNDLVLLCKYFRVHSSEMNITGTLPQAGNLKLFVPSLSTEGSTGPKQNMFNVVLMRPDKTE